MSNTSIFENSTILEHDLEKFLLANGYDVHDDADCNDAVIDSCKVIEIAHGHGFEVADPDDAEKHESGLIFVKMT